jgi:hypothetical protein
MFMQRVHYTHQNPVRLGLVERAEDYRYSSARLWNRTPLEDEPPLVNTNKIRWRKEESAAEPRKRLSSYGEVEPPDAGGRRSRRRKLSGSP